MAADHERIVVGAIGMEERERHGLVDGARHGDLVRRRCRRRLRRAAARLLRHPDDDDDRGDDRGGGERRAQAAGAEEHEALVLGEDRLVVGAFRIDPELQHAARAMKRTGDLALALQLARIADIDGVSMRAEHAEIAAGIERVVFDHDAARVNASVEFRQHLSRVLVRRALEACGA